MTTVKYHTGQQLRSFFVLPLVEILKDCKESNLSNGQWASLIEEQNFYLVAVEDNTGDDEPENHPW